MQYPKSTTKDEEIFDSITKIVYFAYVCRTTHSEDL